MTIADILKKHEEFTIIHGKTPNVILLGDVRKLEDMLDTYGGVLYSDPLRPKPCGTLCGLHMVWVENLDVDFKLALV